MKSFGSISEFHRERSRDLLRAYFRYIDDCPYISIQNVWRAVVDMPASQFWVSAPRAAVVVGMLARGQHLPPMRANKREMFLEIYSRVVALRRRYPAWSLIRLVRAVVSQPAPKFYLAPSSARILILKARKQWFSDLSRKLPPC